MTCGSYIDVLFVVLMKGNPLYLSVVDECCVVDGAPIYYKM